jgi:Fe-S-cluster formation regulator IscX/YfhJ
MNGLTGMNGLSGTIPPSTLNTPNGQQQAKPAEPVPSSMSDQVTDADFPEMNEDELKFAVIHELKVRIQAWVDDPAGNSRNLSAFIPAWLTPVI